MINYSIVGRGATLGERKLYVSWDTENDERNRIAKEFKDTDWVQAIDRFHIKDSTIQKDLDTFINSI